MREHVKHKQKPAGAATTLSENGKVMSMNRIFCLTAFVVSLFFTTQLVSAEDASPTDAERQAVAVLAEKGAIISIDRSYAVSSVTLSSSRGREFGDDDLVHLQAFPALSRVTLSGSTFSDSGLKHLNGLKNLKQLIVLRSSITEAGIGKFKEENPNCSVQARFGSGSAFGSPNRLGGRTRPSSTTSAFASRSPSAERLRYDAVLDDLKLGQKQREQIQELLTSTDRWNPLSESLQQIRSENDPEKRTEMQGQLRETLDRLTREYETSIRGVLNSEQQNRLDQLILQRQGPRALVNPDVVTKLKLSDDQVSQLVRVVGARPRFGFRNPADLQSEQEWEAKMLEVLTPEQQEAWKKLLGPPLEQEPASRTPRPRK